MKEEIVGKVFSTNKEGLLVKETLLNYVNIVDGCFFWNDNIGSKRAGKPLKTYACTVSFKGVIYRYKDIEALLKGDVDHIVASTSTPEGYHIWNAMQKRCKVKGYPISDVFSKYETWIEWARQQKGFKEKDFFNAPFNLDSDLFSNTVKTYSEDTCVFIPQHLNQIYKTSYKDNEMLGVDFVKGKYRARIHMFNSQVILGSYEAKEDAIKAYRNKRAECVQLLLNLHRHQLEDKTVEFLEDDIKNNIFM